MIQRLIIILTDASKITDALGYLKTLGFPDEAVRVVTEEGTGTKNIFAYRDGDWERTRRIDRNRINEIHEQATELLGTIRIVFAEFATEGEIEEVS